MMMRINNPDVVFVFESYPEKVRQRLLFLRQLILETAAETDGVGELNECLKWGQPSYVTGITKSGSTIRIDRIKAEQDQYAMFFHCQTTLVSTFRKMYGDDFVFGGNRSIIFERDEEIPVEKLKTCIALALTYHLDKKKRA